MNSETWKVTGGGHRWVFKIVGPKGPPGFLAGLRAAVALEASGILAGAPASARDHHLIAGVDEGLGALLSGVDGDAHHLGREPCVRIAVAHAVHEWERIRPEVSTWDFLHGDPAPEVFRQNGSSDECGIIDWASGVHGPCVCDLASACMYLDRGAGSDVVEAHAASSPVPRREIELGLPALLRHRYAVQADYFARRLKDGDLMGLTDQDGNQRGLDDAHQMLGG